MISIESSDGTVFRVHRRHACISRLLRDAISEDSDNDGDNDYDINNDNSTDNHIQDANNDTPMQLINVKSECLQHIINYMNHYAQDPMNEIPIPLNEEHEHEQGGASFHNVVPQKWYRDFVNDQESTMLFQLVTAADYMDIQPLLSLTCLKVSSNLMGKSSEQIREILNISKLTPKEEAEAREEHSWMFAD